MASRATPATEPERPDPNTGSTEQTTVAFPMHKTARQQPQPDPPQGPLGATSPPEDLHPEEGDLSPEEKG